MTKALNGIIQKSARKNRIYPNRIATFLLIALSLALPAAAQNAGPPQSATPAAPTNSQDVVTYLNDSITWYRQVSAEAAMADEPGESLITTANRRLATEYLRCAFQYARAQAALLEQSNATGDSSADPQKTSTRARIQTSLDQTNGRISDIEKQLSDLSETIDTAKGAALQQMTARREMLRSQLALAQARKATLT